MLDDRQPEPGATSGARPVGAEEALEQPRHVLVGDAGAVVGDIEHDVTGLARERDHAGRALAGVAERVLEQVLGHEPQHPSPQRHVNLLVLDPQLQAQPAELRPFGQLGDEVAQDGGSLGVAERDDLPALLELAQEEHVVHELGHLDDLVARPPQEALQVGAGQLGGLEQRLQPRERRAQLVRDRRGERGSQRFVVGVGH